LAQRRHAGEAELLEYSERAADRVRFASEKTNHVFIIVEGEATLVTGGTLVNPKAASYHLSKGDVITIRQRRQTGLRKCRRSRSPTTG
jgi:hypothetical protein